MRRVLSVLILQAALCVPALASDPQLGSFLGGSLRDRAEGVVRAPDGTLYVCGTTASANFPVTAGAEQGALAGLTDAFVAHLDPATGQVLWATYLGGNDTTFLVVESANDIVLTSSALYVAGVANSPDFPTTPGALARSPGGGVDAFVACFALDGTLGWSTYLGASKDDRACALAVDAAGDVVVAGRTTSDDFPTTPGAFDESFNSTFFFNDAFVSRIAMDGSELQWSTFLGGTLRDEICDVVLGTDGSATVAGITGSSDFPATPGAYDQTFNGAAGSDEDGFVARLAGAGDALQWATYLGGTGQDEVQALALDAGGVVTLAGITMTADFPSTPGAAQGAYGGGASDAFAGRLSASGSSLLWASYLGGSGDDAVIAVALQPDGTGQVTLAGWTTSIDLPVTPAAFDATPEGGRDVLLARLSETGAALRYGSYAGGAALDEATDLVLDEHGAALLAGQTDSSDLPTTAGAFDATYNGAGDVLLLELSVPPWADLGLAKAGTGGLLPRLVGSGTVVAGSSGSLSLSDAKRSAPASLFVGLTAGNLPFKGGTLVPFPFLLNLAVGTFPNGTLLLPWFAWPAGLPSGLALHFQIWIADPGATSNASASNGLRATLP